LAGAFLQNRRQALGDLYSIVLSGSLQVAVGVGANIRQSDVHFAAEIRNLPAF
jgi:hypothetical protein